METKASTRSPLRRRLFLVAALATLAALEGCARVPKEAGFSDVKASASARLGKEVIWNRGRPEDAAVAEWVRTKLREELSADSAVQIALINNRNLQASYEDLGVAQADVVQAGLLPNPLFAGNAKPSVNGGEGPEIEFNIAMNFVEAILVPIRKRVVKARFEETKISVTRSIMEHAVQTRRQYYAVVADEQMVEMREQVAETTSASLTVAQRLHQAGNTRDLDLADEEAQRAGADLDRAMAEATLRQSRERLISLLGLWGGDTAILTPHRLPDIPSEDPAPVDLEKAAISRSLELAALRHRIEAAARILGIAKGTALIPDLELGFAAKKEVDGNRLAGPGISLPLPFFNQGQSKIAAAKAELRRLQYTYYGKAVEIRSSARSSLDRLRMARAQAAYFKDVALPLKHRILNETQLQYNAMQVGVFHLLEARREEIEAGGQYVERLRDYWLARTDLDSLLQGHMAEGGEVARTSSLRKKGDH